MKLATLFPRHCAEQESDERAVSPVIAVILMVAITVILSAVVGSFALGLGNEIRQVTPTASFDFEYAKTGGGNYSVTATHEGGVTVSSSNAQSLVLAADSGQSTEFGLPAAAGTSATLDGGDAVSPGTDIRVVWTSTDGSSSQTLATGTTPG